MKSLIAITALVGGLLAVNSHATQVAFSDWVYNSSDEIDWLVTIDDSMTPGVFTFMVEIGNIADDPVLTGDILGFGFDSEASFDLSTDLTMLGGVTAGNFGYDSSTCGNGCNFNGLGDPTFDYIFSVGQQGSSDDYLTAFSFTLANNGGDSLASDPDLFSRVGIRAQSVGINCDEPEAEDCEGSIKDYSGTGSVTVPEPNSLALFTLGLFAVGMLRKRANS